MYSKFKIESFVLLITHLAGSWIFSLIKSSNNNRETGKFGTLFKVAFIFNFAKTRGVQPAAQKYFCAAQTGFRIQ
jgi:hypothetical protein